ncbi:S41 family peptidase [Silvibacterium dinghuense]|uniref:PDZ domain-containing protein n=1 Tax=Silvibacterium dinghuense TaxID=1560006 RepID=A0A4V1NVG0_9BACT|nr:S41 family peptidase [Silvibacterium dinghuense]RXS95640.1 PDZ domain-containing protein [Silvibacterium dinghuense]GGH14623.1 peptidase S41 [Silvibacterium dinghuense]
MSKAFKRSVLAVSVALVAIVFLGGFLTGGVNAGSQADGVYRQMGVYEEVLHKIQSDYVTEPSINDVTTGALHGLLESLDADSSYLTPAEYSAYKAHANEETAQVGLLVSKRYGYATVVAVIPGSPADKEEHIMDGDLLEAIGGKSTSDMSLAMIRLSLEGKPGTDVTFSIVRPGKPEPQKITLTRTNITAPPLAEQQYENSSILYLKPGTLSKDRVNEIEAKLKAMPKNGNKKVLLDLRDVVEGDSDQAIRLANAFLKSGNIASLSGQKFSKQTFNADPEKFITDAPLVILINHGTAGPAEIVAAAILDNKRGDLVGDRSFGEGAIQKTIEIPDGSAVILSVAKYDSPSGKAIQDTAVTPNIIVTESIDQYLAEESLDESEQPTERVQPTTDDQLTRALDVLKQKAA